MANRQKKLEKKKSKRTEKKRASLRAASAGVTERMQRAAAAPLLDVLLFHREDPNSGGMTQMLFSRRLPSGEVATAFWLIDLHLLGLKDGWGRVMPFGEYKEMKERIEDDFEPEPIDSASARKLVDDAVAYARTYGFEPHPDARKALPILGDIDASLAKRTFTFGKDGKPFYVAGPNDSLPRQLRIVEQLKRTAGEGNFHYAHSSSADDFDDLGDYDMDMDDQEHIHGPDCQHDHDHDHDHSHDHDCSRDHDHDH